MKKTDVNYNEFVSEMNTVWGGDSHMIDFCVKNTTRVVKLTDGVRLVSFEKKRIDTDFYFGYSDCGQGMSYEECSEAQRNASKNIEDYFVNKNMWRAGFDDDIEALNDPSKKLYIGVHYYKGKNLYYWRCVEPWHVEGEVNRGDLILCDNQKENRAILIDAIKEERAAYEKRLKAYLKRYGTKKMTINTYWVDE